MPNMNGLELIRKVRTLDNYKHTPILFLTTETQQAIIEEAKRSGATGWITKPFSSDKLIRIIKKSNWLMEEYNKLFITEAKEFIQSLEDALIILEKDPLNKQQIDEVFRFMHSLKGSGAMFGFSDLSDFTHHLETLYDEIRKNKILLNRTIVSFTLNSLDHIKKLLCTNLDNETLDKSKELVSEINQFISGESLTDNIEKQSQKPIKILSGK